MDAQDLTPTDLRVLEFINKKLDVLGLLHEEIKDLKESLEFTYQQISGLQRDNFELRSTLSSFISQGDFLKKENKLQKEAVLDVQSRSMRDSLIFSAILKNNPDNSEAQVKKFMETVEGDVVDYRCWGLESWVHRLGHRGGQHPRPIGSKFELFQQKVHVKS